MAEPGESPLDQPVPWQHFEQPFIPAVHNGQGPVEPVPDPIAPGASVSRKITATAQTNPRVSTAMGRMRPFTSLPARRRTASRNTACTRFQVPLHRQRRTVLSTVFHGGYTRGEPERHGDSPMPGIPLGAVQEPLYPTGVRPRKAHSNPHVQRHQRRAPLSYRIMHGILLGRSPCLVRPPLFQQLKCNFQKMKPITNI
jgi:hypothetical protein